MTLGVCYFPEHWPPETWSADVERMRDAGLDYVRMGEFAWSEIEPSREEFRVDWLRDVLDEIDRRDMDAVLCTPTATPPKWLTDEHPDVLRETIDGTTQGFGSRREYCFNSTRYRAETERVVTRLAEEFRDHSAVVGWQIDNEFGCHDTIRCYCEECDDAFREYLRDRYDTIDDLNRAWGTAFWSQHYPSVEAVEQPKPTPSAHHPSLLLEYYRFASRSAVDYGRFQADLIRSVNDDWFLTHNMIGQFETLDAYPLAADLDFVAWDSYPTGFPQTGANDQATTAELRLGDPDQLALNHALYRGMSEESFWIMEQQPGDINWSPHSPQPADGAMRLWALHALGHGAGAVLYFRWRACTQGQEQYHSGLLDHAGRRDRGYRDARSAASAVDALDLQGTTTDAEVAVLHDYENLWALGEQPHSPDFEYWSHLRTYFDALRTRGVTVDVVHPRNPLDDYRVVVAPTLHLGDDALATHLRGFVEAGGTLVLTVRSGVKDIYNKVHTTPPPGPLAALVGATVAEHETVPSRLPTRVDYDGEAFGYRTWGEWLDPETAAVEGRHASGVAAGKPAVTRNAVGDGAATYVGVWPGESMVDRLLCDVLDEAGVAYRANRLPDGVRIIRRGPYAFVTNFSLDTWAVSGVADGDVRVGSSTLAPGDALVVETDDESFGFSKQSS